MAINQKLFDQQCSYWDQIKGIVFLNTLKCPNIQIKASNYCKKLKYGKVGNLPNKVLFDVLWGP